MDGIIEFKGNEIPLYTDAAIRPGPEKDPVTSERCFELALGKWYMETRKGPFLEIGAVTPYYWPVSYAVVDVADPAPEAVHVSVLNILDFKGKHVLSISTLEHVEPAKEAVRFIRKIMAEAASYMLTVPVGWQYAPAFDRLIRESGLGSQAHIYNRIAKDCWKKTNGEYKGTYGTPFKYANTIAVFYKEM